MVSLRSLMPGVCLIVSTLSGVHAMPSRSRSPTSFVQACTDIGLLETSWMYGTCLDQISGQKINSSIEIASYISFADDKLDVRTHYCYTQLYIRLTNTLAVVL
jgi:hypothetical protein